MPPAINPRDDALRLESRRLADGWRGHYPITSEALLSLLDRAAVGQSEFSRIERCLWVACEFWAAVQACELDAHLDSSADDPLGDARSAFSAIGAEHVVDILRQSAVGSVDSQPEGARRKIIADIENRMLRVADPVDVLIARLARQYLSTRSTLPSGGCDRSNRSTRSAITAEHSLDQLGAHRNPRPLD